MDQIRSFCYNNGDINISSTNNCQVIIGRAKKGPILTPVFASALTDYITLSNIFGADSELLTAFYEACDGSTQICLINIEGCYAALQVSNLFRLESKDIDDDFNKDGEKAITISYAKDRIRISNSQFPSGIEYLFEGETVSSLAEKINTDAMLAVVPVVATYYSATAYESATKLYDELYKISSGEDIVLSKDGIFTDNYHNFYKVFDDIIEEDIDSISILPFSFYEKEREPINIVDIMYTDKTDIQYVVGDGDIKQNICLKVELNSSEYDSIDVNSDISIVFENEEDFIILEKKNSYLYLIPTDKTTCFDLTTLKNKVLFKKNLYIYEMINHALVNNLTIGNIQFVNMGIKIEEDLDIDKILNFYTYIKNNMEPNSYINIIIDKYQNRTYYDDYKNLSNGLGFLVKAMNAVTDFNNITGYIDDTFRNTANTLTYEEIEDLANKGFITTCVYKNKHRINSGKNLSYTGKNVLGTVGNTILVQELAQDIMNDLSFDMSDIEIKNTIAQILKDVYYEVISSYKIDITSNIDKTKTISKIVNLDICLYGYIQSINLSVGVE